MEILKEIDIDTAKGQKLSDDFYTGNKLYDLNEYLKPYWKGDKVTNESLLMIKKGDNLPSARLLFKPEKILSLKNAFLDKEYKEGIDYTFSEDIIYLTDNSAAEFLTDSDIYSEMSDKFCFKSASNEGYLRLYPKGRKSYHEAQLSVSYIHSDEGFSDYLPPVLRPDLLPLTLEKLKKGETLNFTLFGDSISVGANSSGFDKLPPFLPSWGELIKRKLQMDYNQAKILYHNPSQGGKSSYWGRDMANELVALKKPDLVIIAFGMGDAHSVNNFSPDETKSNILSIINTVLSYNSEAEFIVVSPMMANPDALGFFGRQAEYTKPLLSLEKKGVAFADVNTAHSYILERKGFLSIGGNSANHPNDFITRLYAQTVLSLLTDGNT